MLVDTATRQYRANAATVERRALGLVRTAWARLDTTNTAVVRETMIDLIESIGVSYGEVVALLSAEYYEDLRSAAGFAGGFTPSAEVDLDSAEIRRNVGWAVDPLNAQNSAGALERIATVAGGLLTQVGAGSIRANAEADPAASGWYRIARADGCEFCVMLSQRGAVYKRATVDFAAHGHCNCSAKPAFDPDAKEVDVRAYTASERTAHLRELDAADGGDRYERHKSAVNGWLEINRDSLDTFRSELV